MKKLFVLILCLALSAVAFTGCGSLFNCGTSTVTSTIMTEKPWANGLNYEKITYDVERFSVEYSEDGSTFNTDKTVAAGSYTLTLVSIDGNIKESDEFAALGANADFGKYFTENISNKNDFAETPGAYSILETEYTLTYNDDTDNGDYKNKTDTLGSIVLFRNATLMPVFSFKKADFASSGISYTALADYVNGVDKFTSGGAESPDVSIKENYDNELLYYIVRAQTGLSSGTSTTLSVHNAVESGIYGKEAVNNIAVNVDAGGYYVNGIDANDEKGFVKAYLGNSVEYIDEEKKTEQEKEAEENGEKIEVSVGYALPARIVTVGRTDQNRGPSTTLAYSTVDFSYYGDVTSNVLLSVTDYEFDTETRLISYMNMITISDYTIEK